VRLAVSAKTAVRVALKRLGYRLKRLSAEEKTFFQGHDTSVPLPAGAEKHLRPNHPRLLELERRYAKLDSPMVEHTLWRAALTSTLEDLQSFRGENEYVWQYVQRGNRTAAPGQMRLRYYVYAQYVRDLDHRELLGNRLTEDGQFGCFNFRYPRMPAVSRDLLDSVNELYFLDRHWDLFRRDDVRVLDIGAGYGRLAHRMLMATDSVRRYTCVDAVPRSTYLSEYYLRFRNLFGFQGARGAVVPLDELDASLSQESFDLALNIHSFSEMSHSAIAAWVGLLAKLGPPWLFVIPNEQEMLSREATGARREYRTLIEEAGYRLHATEPTIRDADVADLYGACDHFFLFRRAT
jgi:hypothetical protein